MVRMNITIPEDVSKELRRVKNKSFFIAETLRERFLVERRKETEKILGQAYQRSAQEDRQSFKDWDATASDGIE